ncbi:fungal specific transcription factor domain-containing protein [Purpureocillium lilacinum]|uniref:Fungal specific transcription factor domain-containing protein n=1 Tax=Purpureocillium lilacinum TaxID=33203 RepID=A0A179GYQ2_PURLI|nr:fungal specific transcription factor domain-containing protein [Purpureocillium lilacinum]
MTRDYPTHLQQRIERLERQLAQLKTPGAPSLQPDVATQETSHTEDASPESSVDALVADIAALPALTSSYPLTGDGSTFSTVLLGVAGQTVPTRDAYESGIEPVDLPLPEWNAALKLAKHYIARVYPRLPFFSIQGFWVQFDQVFPPDEPAAATEPPVVATAGRQRAPAPPVDIGYSRFTVLLVLAISSSSLSQSADSIISRQAQRLFNAALEYHKAAILPHTIVGVQSLLFLIQYATLNPSVLDAWYLIGVGMRNCIDLGLHQDPRPIESISPSLLETRRRLWWSMYSFDRSMSMGCGRPTEIADPMIKAELPCFRIESTASEDDIQGYLQRYRGLQLQSRIYEALNKPPAGVNTDDVISNLLKELRSWQSQNSPAHNQLPVETEWHMGMMLLHRPCRLLPERTLQEYKRLWDAAVGFVTLYRQLVDSNGIFYVQIACEKAYWSGLAILHAFWKLFYTRDGESPDGESLIVRQADLWKAMQHVMAILRVLSERWDKGRLLAQRFEAAVISPSFNRHYTLTIRETQSQPGNMATKTTLPGGKVHDLPADLAAALMDDETAKAVWLDITVLARNEFICWVSDAKQASTRERRIRRTVEGLNEGKRRPCCWPGCSHRERTGK